MSKELEKKYKKYLISKYDEHCENAFDGTGTRPSFIKLLDEFWLYSHPNIESAFEKAHLVISCYIKDEKDLLLDYADFKIKHREIKIDNIIND